MTCSVATPSNGKLITIVIPVYNRERLLVRTLDSIAVQDTGRINLIVVDNASTDGSRRVAEQWCRAHDEVDAIVTDCEVPGAAAARNVGLRLAATSYVMFFDSDDEMLPGHLEMVVKGIEEHPEAEILGWPVKIETGSGKSKIGIFSRRSPLCRHLVHSAMSTQRYVSAADLLRNQSPAPASPTIPRNGNGLWTRWSVTLTLNVRVCSAGWITAARCLLRNMPARGTLKTPHACGPWRPTGVAIG